jgi:tRNA A37 N6-isopentenylltransferase MiaA
VRRHVLGELERQEMIEQIVTDTRQYAKRQRTWFRHQLEPELVTRVSPGVSGWQEKVERWILACRRDARLSQGAATRAPAAGNP